MLGLDPGLNSTGYAVASVDLAKRQIICVHTLGVLTTRRDNSRRVRRSSDDFRRAKSLVLRIRAISAEHDIKLVAAEMASTSPYKRISLNFGVMLGILASLDCAVIEVLPQQIKQAITGTRSGEKLEIIKWALGITGEEPVGWPTSKLPNRLGLTHRGRPVTLAAEHPADALAVIQAALESEQFNEIVALLHALEAA